MKDSDHIINTKIFQRFHFQCIFNDFGFLLTHDFKSKEGIFITSAKEVMFSPGFVCPSVCL